MGKSTAKKRIKVPPVQDGQEYGAEESAATWVPRMAAARTDRAGQRQQLNLGAAPVGRPIFPGA
jgi:hypothetical protein